jgi:hypothetical protein
MPQGLKPPFHLLANVRAKARTLQEKTYLRAKAHSTFGVSGTAKQAAENSAPGGKATPQGLKPDVFSIIYGPTKVVP